MEKVPFKEYLEQPEPSKRDKGYAWYTAIGLQNVDGLKPSSYLLDTAKRNIESEITIDQAQALLNSYYRENPVQSTQDRTEEADKVSARIAKLLSEQAFSFTINEYISIHKQLFINIYPPAGQIRTYNITKEHEYETVYGTASELKDTITYDLTFLELFLRNLLLKEQNRLSNRMMHISHVFEKVDIDSSKVDIHAPKVDIERLIKEKLPKISTKTRAHIAKLYVAYKTAPYFGRTDVSIVLDLKPAMASRLLKMMLANHLMKSVRGKGKGKYRFVQSTPY